MTQMLKIRSKKHIDDKWKVGSKFYVRDYPGSIYKIIRIDEKLVVVTNVLQPSEDMQFRFELKTFKHKVETGEWIKH